MIICAAEPCRIASGHFISVVVHRDQVYVTDLENNRTQVYQHSTTPQTGWRQQRYIDHVIDMKRNPNETEYFNTLSISNNQLKCCSLEDGVIKVYSLSGDELQTYDTRGSDDADQLLTPVISDDDDDGSVLITDLSNGRLQVMSEQGEFSVLQLQPPVSQPRDAMLFNDKLYVTSMDDKAIYKYSC